MITPERVATSKWDEAQLKEWFSQLSDADVVDRRSTPQSGGNLVRLIWETPAGDFYQTTHNDWNIKVKWTTLQKMTAEKKIITRFIPIGEVIRKEEKT